MLSRIRIVFDKNILFENTKAILLGITRRDGKQIDMPTDKDGFFIRQLNLLSASLCDTLRPLLYDETEPTLTSDGLVICVSLYAKRQMQMLPASLEHYICNNIAYGWLVENGYGYDVIDMRKIYNDLHHVILMKDGLQSRKPNF